MEKTLVGAGFPDAIAVTALQANKSMLAGGGHAEAGAPWIQVVIQSPEGLIRCPVPSEGLFVRGGDQPQNGNGYGGCGVHGGIGEGNVGPIG